MRAAAAALISILLATVAPLPAVAQDDAAGASYVTPFPENDIYRLNVVGDWLAEGLLVGLVEALGGDGRLQIQRRHRALQGLARADFDEDMRALEEALGREPLHIAVVLVGAADRVPLRAANGRRIAVGSEEWRSEYGRRVDRLIKTLKRRNAASYWVGLPVVRRPEWNDDVQMINEIFREKAYLNGAKYIDIYAGFADEAGSYSPYGPDLTGKSRLLREADGVSFTAAGNRKLAHFVEREIRRDLTQARSQRSIPLAGSEAEQRKINPAKPGADPTQSAAASVPGIASKPGKDARAPVASPAPAPPVGSGTGDQKADNTRIALKSVGAGGREEVTTLDLLRPAISASVIALVTRRESAERASQMGDTLQDVIPGGLMVLSSVTPANQGGGRRGALSPTQTAFFKVMVKGERLSPKLGRADDFAWPRMHDDGELAGSPPRAAPRVPPARGPAPVAKPAPRG